MAVNYIRKLYQLERAAQKRSLSPTEIYELRQEQAKPILEEFKDWLEQKQAQTPPKGLLGKAVSYTLHQWHQLIGYLEDGQLDPDNNKTENCIRPFELGITERTGSSAGPRRGQKPAPCSIV